MSLEEKKTKGNLKISENVIETIAATAAAETHGVAALVPAPNLKGTLKASAPEAGVVVKMTGDVAKIDVYVKVLKGTKIPEVGDNIQKSVKSAVQSMSKVIVEKVNVIIAGVKEEE
ncbi:MAG: Asp23/Gls24 family envelope stress response protein [Oscillospiraceae bacterium]|nr:Asp23/Gls24 family envelope stress response protein [Oscillospiraceae bacterium]